MQAKCPFCDVGCDKCVDGFIDVQLAEGTLYTKVCLKCGFESGGRITGPGLPPIEDNLGDPMKCWIDGCDGDRVYRLVGKISRT